MGYRIVRMATELFTQIMTEGYTHPSQDGCRLRIVKGLPEGAKLEAVSMDLYFVYDAVALKYSHPSWPDLPPGVQIPELRIEFQMEEPTEDPPLLVNPDLTPKDIESIREAIERNAPKVSRIMVLPCTPNVIHWPADAPPKAAHAALEADGFVDPPAVVEVK